MMSRLLLSLLLLCSLAAAQTVGQYEIRKRGASGFTSYGVTLSNGQVIGQTAGIPAAITPFGGAFSDLSGKPTTLSGYGITDGLTTTSNLSDLTSAATARTNLGLGTAATLAWSDDGDAGAVPIYTGSSELGAVNFYSYLTTGYAQVGKIKLTGATSGVVELLVPSIAGSGSVTFPANTTGTVITTGNLTDITATGTIASGTWNGTAIGLGYLAQGGATSGQVLSWNGTTWAPAAGGGGLTIGSTTITSGTTTRVLYNNGGVVGEYTISGTGNVAMTTSPIFTTPALGTPSSGTLTNCTGLPAAAVVAGTLGTGNFTITGNLATTRAFTSASASGVAGLRVGSSENGLRHDSGTGLMYVVVSGYDYVRFSTSVLSLGWAYPIVWTSGGSGPDTSEIARFGAETTATLQAGLDTNGDAVDQTIKAADGITGTDRSGGDLNLKPGLGTGAGAVSAVIFSTPTVLGSGTTAQSYTERARINSSGLTIGSGGSAISKVLTATATLDFGSIAAQSSADLTITVTGAAAGEAVMMGLPATASAGVVFNAIVTSANTVTIRATNTTASAIDPASATYRATVIQH